MKKMLLWLGFIVGILVLSFVGVGTFISAPKYKGAQTDHFDGGKFHNPGNVQAKGFFDLIKWVFNREQGSWDEKQSPTQTSSPIASSPEVVATDQVTFINHSTFLFRINGLHVLTDPIWSQRASPFQWAGPQRVKSPGLAFEDLPDIDFVIISHNHYDHLDINTIKRLQEEHDPNFITPLGVGAYLKDNGINKWVDLDWWDEKQLSDQIKLTSVPAQHFSGRGTFDRDATLWCGYVLSSEKGHIYFAGDTGYGDFVKTIAERFGSIDFAFIPIGAYKPIWFMSPIHLSPEDAVKVHQDISARVSVAMHFGTFPMADDGRYEPIMDLQRALQNVGISPREFVVPTEGLAMPLAWETNAQNDLPQE